MAQLLTDELVILHDPIESVFDIMPVGGSLVQRQNTITGEYSPDRTLTPMALSPTLQVSDPNLPAGEQQARDVTAEMAVNWYLVTTDGGTESEEEIVAESGDFALSGKDLVVSRNVAAGDSVHVRFKGQYVNTGTNEPLKFLRDFNLTTEPYVEFNPAVEVDLPNFSVVSPFQLTASNRQRAVTARFFAGMRDLSADAAVTFLWEKLDGTSYRPIAATDVEVASVAGNVMTLNLDCVGRKFKYRVTAWHSAYAAAEHRRSALFTLHRQNNSNVSIRTVRGKFLKAGDGESEEELVVTVNSNEIANPGDFYRAHWSMYRQNGQSQEGLTDLGWGMRAIAGRSVSGYDKTKVPTFRVEAHWLSEFQLVTDASGNPVTDDGGEYVTGQTMEN